MPDSAVSLPTRCTLCPRRCGADRAAGRRGACGADGALRVARAALHKWEEPVISVGAGSGTVFFTGCPLRCCYCQNARIATQAEAGAEVDVQRLARIFLEFQNLRHAANINLVTPTQYVPWILAALQIARREGLSVPIVYNTSGYESVETVRMLEGAVGVYLTDFKYAAPEVSNAAAAYSSAPEYHRVAREALDEMVRQVGGLEYVGYAGDAAGAAAGEPVLSRGVIVRHLLLPGRLADSKAVVAELWERYGDTVAYSFMSQYTPMGRFPDHPELERSTAAEEYEELLDFADSLGMEDYFWQEGFAAKESFIPSWNLQGVLQA